MEGGKIERVYDDVLCALWKEYKGIKNDVMIKQKLKLDFFVVVVAFMS